MRMYRMGNEDGMPSFPQEATLILNTASPLVAKIDTLQAQNADKAKELASYLYRLALLSQRRLDAGEMQAFLKDSYRLLGELAQ